MSRTALTLRDTLCAIVGAVNLLLCVLTSASALMMAVSVMMIGLPMYTTIDRLRTPTPKAVPTPAKLALEAKDQAAEAADLGLPTGVWIDLAAAWTTWAEQEEAEKAPETPRERPKPSSGGGEAAKASHALPWVVSESARLFEIEETLHVMSGHNATDLPQVRATDPPSDVVIVGSESMKIPPSTTGYSTLLVLRNEDPATGHWVMPEDPTRTDHWHLRKVVQVPAGTTSYENLGFNDRDEVRVLARIDMPANTSTVKQSQIVDLRAGVAKLTEQPDSRQWYCVYVAGGRWLGDYASIEAANSAAHVCAARLGHDDIDRVVVKDGSGRTLLVRHESPLGLQAWVAPWKESR